MEAVQFNIATGHAEHQLVLQNPLILDHIFGHLPVSDLKACTLVQKSWRQSSQKALRKPAYIKINDDDKMTRFIKFFQSKDSDRSRHLYVNFSLTNKRTKLSTTSFWSVFGASVNRLKLSHYNFKSADNFRKVIFQLCPNMKQLILNNVDTCKIEDEWKFYGKTTPVARTDFPVNTNLKCFEIDMSTLLGISWIEIFDHFPAIEILHCSKRHVAVDNPNQFEDMFHAIKHIRLQDQNKLRLREVEITDLFVRVTGMSVPPSMSDVLQDPNLCLEILVISLGGHENESAIVSGILNVHRGSLKSLKVYGPMVRNKLLNPLDCFPHNVETSLPSVLANLEEVVLCHDLFASLTFLKLTPNLRKLTVAYVGTRPDNIISRTDFNEMRGVRLEKCLQVQLNGCGVDEDLQNLVKLLPNVEQLTCPLTNQTFELVCKNLPNLVCLDGYPSEVDECGLTGLDANHLEFVNKSNAAGCPEMPITVPRACISNLKHLRTHRLTSRSRAERDCFKLTYAAAIIGLQQAPSLKRVYLQNYVADSQVKGLLPNLSIYQSQGPTAEERTLASIREFMDRNSAGD